MIINNTSLAFTDSPDDCRSNNFCQIVAKEDNPVWQINTQCDEVTGGGEKMPCEENQIGIYTSDFYTDVPINEEVIITDTYIKFISAQSAANNVRTVDLFLEPNRCYFLRYSVTNYQSGYISTKNGIQRNANGTYTEVYCTDEFGFLEFFYGSDVDPEIFTSLILSNIFISCIRYSELYEISTEGVDEGDITFSSQTSITKSATTGTNVTVTLRDIGVIIADQSYRFCITISDGTSGGVTVDVGSEAFTYSTNGRHCEDVVIDGLFAITLSDDFIGTISDITITPIPEINVGLFDCDGNEIDGALTVTNINGSAKVELSNTVEPGCYTVGVADSCSNYKHQFYGNVLDVENKYSATINTSTGAWTAGLPNEEGFWGERIKFFDAVCCDKTYSFTINVSYSGGEDLPVIDIFAVTIIIGGTQYTENQIEGNPLEFAFTGITSGCENTDIEIVLEYQWSGDAFIGTIGLSGADEEVAKSIGTFGEGQFCPEKQSQCIKVVESANTCNEPTVLVQYRNDNNAFGFDYTSEGFTEADGFYNKMRIPAKVWNPSYPKKKDIQKNSNGLRSLYYSDVDKKFVLTTGKLPESMHDALSVALEHGTFIIDDVEYVCSSETYEPEWTKNSALAHVEIELFAQRPRMVNTKC